MGLNLGAFWEGAAPGVNAAVEDARRHQQERMQAEHDIITGYADPSKYHPSVVAAAQQQLLEMAQDHVNGKYKAGKYVKGLAPLLNPSAAPGAAMTGPPAADAGGAGAPAGGDAQAYSGTLPGKPGAELSQGSAALPDQSPTEAPAAGGPPQAGATGAKPPNSSPAPSPAPVPAPPQPAQAAPAAPGGPPAPLPAAGTGKVSQALQANPSTAQLMQNPFMQEVAQIADALHASGLVAGKEDIRKSAAKEFGATPEQLEDPNYEFTDANGQPGIRRDPAKAAAREGYAKRRQHLEDQGGTEGRSLAGQIYATKRAEGTADAAQGREDTREHARQAHDARMQKDRQAHESRLADQYNRTATAKDEGEARREHQKAYEAAAKLEKPPGGTAALLDSPREKAARTAAAQAARDKADTELKSRLGKGGAGASASGGPPPPPDRVERARSLEQRIQRGGLSALSAQEREELAGYKRSKVI